MASLESKRYLVVKAANYKRNYKSKHPDAVSSPDGTEYVLTVPVGKGKLTLEEVEDILRNKK